MNEGFFDALIQITRERKVDRETLLEALALKRPVVCTAVGGIPEIIEDGKQGVLIRANDLSGLTEALRFLLHHPEIAKKLGYAGRELIEKRYCDEVMVKETRKVYMELLQ